MRMVLRNDSIPVTLPAIVANQDAPFWNTPDSINMRSHLCFPAAEETLHHYFSIDHSHNIPTERSGRSFRRVRRRCQRLAAMTGVQP